MGQKVHPVGFRLGITKDHLSCWYADPKEYPQLLQEDHLIRKYIDKNLSNASIAEVKIDRKADQIDLSIHTARPGVVVGKGGAGIEKLRTDLQNLLKNQRQFRVNVIEVANVDANAALMAEFIGSQLERRVSFRRVVRQALQRAEKAEVKGIKIQVSGRLNGAEIARSEWIREGRVPLHTLRADIDYCYRTASTIYGILGVKVWIFKGEVIPGEENLETPAPRGNRERRQPRRQKFEDRSE
ncbi:SSU ribosomal protein S3 RpsC [Cyanobacterium sp. HL-69]|uniref:30S ribosomal protein S3 n=1 Tax=unclassified Cyanobacterium TaxID=2629879 RepID=UPI0008527D41|nr:30S ribosomal protein S3 [Cyanobacterium sp. IPPAS B-1200]AUC59853.1 SSU ribosomal protein S3 RpsC [Cyanobacterium sp. HL-69]OEJ79183.1 30S ribosomal protein S3 [Cyanobacterium sp. IPPAS B-1200]